jgi:hypothetical protein
MLQQFRRAIAVTAANGHSQHILQLLHYVRGTEQEARDACRSHLVTTDGDHTSVEVIVGLIHTYRRDVLCLNNSVMDTIIICPEAVIIGR